MRVDNERKPSAKEFASQRSRLCWQRALVLTCYAMVLPWRVDATARDRCFTVLWLIAGQRTRPAASFGSARGLISRRSELVGGALVVRALPLGLHAVPVRSMPPIISSDARQTSAR